MKRTAAALLALALALTLCVPALAATGVKGVEPSPTAPPAALDMDYFAARPDLYEMRDYPEAGVTMIWPNETAESCAFIHAHESDHFWSTARFMLAVYASPPVVVIPRLEIIYSADEPINFRGVSIDVCGRRFTFDGRDVDRRTVDRGEYGVQEHLFLQFSDANWAFVEALAAAADAVPEGERGSGDPRIHAVLHGDEDLDVFFSPTFLADFRLMLVQGLNAVGGTAFLHRLTPAIDTPMTITDAPEAPEAPASAVSLLDPLLSHPELYSVHDSSTANVTPYAGGPSATVISTFTEADLRFGFKGEALSGRGVGRFVLLFQQLLSDSPVCYPGFMLTLVSDRPLNVTHLAFPILGTTYTFDVRGSTQSWQEEDGSSVQMIQMVFNRRNGAFLNALLDYFHSASGYEEADALPLPVTLIGDETIDAVMHEPIMSDCWLLIEAAVDLTDAIDLMVRDDNFTPMTTDASAPVEP